MPREDFIPYVADFFLQLEDMKWTIVAGIVNGSFVVSVRNIGYTRNAGEFVRKLFADIGSAGGHRAMAKAVVPVATIPSKFGRLDPATGTEPMLELALQFLHDNGPQDNAKKGHGRTPIRSVTDERGLDPVTDAHRSRSVADCTDATW